MKKAKWMIINVLLITGMAQSASVTLDENTPAKVASWYGGYPNGAPTGVAKSGVGNNVTIRSLVVGMAANKIATNNTRGGLDFDVSGQQTITNATLNLYLTGKTPPSYDLAVYAKMTNGALHASSPLAKAAYSENDYVDTGLRLATDSAAGWHAFDVTSVVTAAVANGGVVSFRFQMLNDDGLPFTAGSVYALSSFGSTATAPSLDLCTTP
jgi:hypothetical protein